jgi:FKBP-type peptidyl-prolyl cis-trans isomerase SlyD
MTITDGRKVGIEYTLKLDDGTTVDTNVGGKPLVFEQGGGEILPALEHSLQGMQVNDTKQVTLSPEQGYGTVKSEAYRAVATDLVPAEAREVGTPLMLQAPDGQQIPVRVHEVKPTEVVLDFNHPLAGETLNFDVRVLSVE